MTASQDSHTSSDPCQESSKPRSMSSSDAIEYYPTIRRLMQSSEKEIEKYLSKATKNYIICLFQELLSQHCDLEQKHEQQTTKIINGIEKIKSAAKKEETEQINSLRKELSEIKDTIKEEEQTQLDKIQDEVKDIKRILNEKRLNISPPTFEPQPFANGPSTNSARMQLRIDGIEEKSLSTDQNQIENPTRQMQLLEHDQSIVNEIFAHLGESPQISDIRRIGPFKLKNGQTRVRPRTLLVTLCNPWDIRKILTKAPMMKSYYARKIFITKALNFEESKREQELLRVRRQLLNDHANPKDLKIRDLCLFYKNDMIYPPKQTHSQQNSASTPAVSQPLIQMNHNQAQLPVSTPQPPPPMSNTHRNAIDSHTQHYPSARLSHADPNQFAYANPNHMTYHNTGHQQFANHIPQFTSSSNAVVQSYGNPMHPLTDIDQLRVSNNQPPEGQHNQPPVGQHPY